MISRDRNDETSWVSAFRDSSCESVIRGVHSPDGRYRPQYQTLLETHARQGRGIKQ